MGSAEPKQKRINVGGLFADNDVPNNSDRPPMLSNQKVKKRSARTKKQVSISEFHDKLEMEVTESIREVDKLSNRGADD